MAQTRTISAPATAAFAGLLALAAAIGIGRFVYTPILPLMLEALHLDRFTAGLLASANYAGYLAGALLAAGRLPGARRTWLIGALFASATTTAAMGATTALPLFLALRFAGGVASAFGIILTSAIVLEVLADAGRLGLSSLLYAGVGIGVLASAALLSALQAAGLGWAALWLASGGLALAACLGVAALMPADAARPVLHTRPNQAATSPLLRRLIAAYGLFGFGYVITATFLVAIVRADAALRAIEPWIWVVFGLAAAPSVTLWTRLARSRGPARGFALAALIEAAGVLATIAWRSIPGVFLAAVLVGGTFMGVTALGLVRGRQLGAGDARRELALMTSAFGLGQIIGPSFAGWLYDALGSLAVPSLAAAAALVLAALIARR